jgi:general secretion pathway protein G
MKRSLSSSRAAFTLLEIMIVVVIIVLLLGFAISKMGGTLDVAKEARVRGDIQSISTQLMVYQTMNGFLPSTEQGLKALVARPDSEPKPRSWRKLMDEEPLDAFGHEYHYTQPGTHNPDKYDLFSGGPDGKPGTADDIGNWKQE